LRKFLQILLSALIITLPLIVTSQGSQTQLSNDDIDNYKQQVSDLIKYLEGTLNFIGDPESVIREKEVIINESFLKIFKDDKVQVEDDLDESRDVTLHKDVQAYLKDIEFFFKTVQFKFIISDITFHAGDGNLQYFKVTLNRDLKGITVEGDSVSNRKTRFMEINLDMNSSDLRIASIYTTKLNKKEEMRYWWNSLSNEWRNVFSENVSVYDSVPLSSVVYLAEGFLLLSGKNNTVSEIQQNQYNLELPPERNQSHLRTDFDTLEVDTREMFDQLSVLLKQRSIDISGNEIIRNLKPLAELSELEELNCSNTLVTRLFPLRNLNRLKVLDFSNTPVDDLTPLFYSISLTEINCSYTLLNDLTPLSGLYNLEKVECSGLRIHTPEFAKELIKLRDLNFNETNIYDLGSLVNLKNLEKLEIAGTGIRHLESMSGFFELKYLNCENTSVTLIEPLIELQNLEVLKISYTGIEQVSPLSGISSLKRIYWDSGDVFQVNREKKRREAIAFMKNNPGSLVIFESEELLNGWATLEEPWKKLASDAANLGEDPTKEELHALLRLEEIDISESSITTLSPVSGLYNLKKINLSGLQIEDYSPLGNSLELEFIDLSNSTVKSLDFAGNLSSLKEINISGTEIKDLSPLRGLNNLKAIYADESGINNEIAFGFRKNNPHCLVIYKTESMNSWWVNLPVEWKDFFNSDSELDSPPSSEQLHKLLFMTELELINKGEIKSFDPVIIFTGLKKITLDGLTISSLKGLSHFYLLEEIRCTRMPVMDISPLAGLRNLRILDIENTPVKDLRPIVTLNKLNVLNVSGTQVRSLKPVANLTGIEEIQLNNTQVKSLAPLLSLPGLNSVSCFNSRISIKNIEKFKAAKPACKVVYY